MYATSNREFSMLRAHVKSASPRSNAVITYYQSSGTVRSLLDAYEKIQRLQRHEP